MLRLRYLDFPTSNPVLFLSNIRLLFGTCWQSFGNLSSCPSAISLAIPSYNRQATKSYLISNIHPLYDSNTQAADTFHKDVGGVPCSCQCGSLQFSLLVLFVRIDIHLAPLTLLVSVLPRVFTLPTLSTRTPTLSLPPSSSLICWFGGQFISNAEVSLWLVRCVMPISNEGWYLWSSKNASTEREL